MRRFTVISLGGGVMVAEGTLDTVSDCSISAYAHWEPPSI